MSTRISGIITAAAGVFGLAQSAWAQSGTSDWSIDLGGDIQARYEYLDNQFRPGRAPSGGALLYRTNVRAIVTKPGIEFGFEVSDARAQFVDNEAELGIALVNALEPLQFYGKLNWQNVLGAGDKLSLQFGPIYF